MIKNRLLQKSIVYIFAFIIALGIPLHAVQAAAPATLRYSDSGIDVPDLQFRLQTLGYFNNEALTSFYGKLTEDAVERFQRDYGLKVDGVTGEKTWTALKKVSVNQRELNLLARIVHAEARGESYEGQVAVAAVVLNRMNNAGFPDTVEGVIEQPGAFTAVDDGQYELTPDSESYHAAQDALRGADPSHGALYYFNPETATSKWIWSRKQIIQIDKHIFAI